MTTATPRIIGFAVALASSLAIGACSSTPAKDADHPASTDSASTPPDGASTSTGAGSTGGTATTSAPAASASSSPSTPAGPEEVAKDPNALILEISVEASSGKLEPADAEKMKAALIAKIATSTKLALPTSKGVTGNRHVTTRLIVDPLVEEKDKLSEKVQLNGVTTDGHCPLFDLNAKAMLQTNKKMDAGDQEAVRVAAVEQVYQKLEADAANLKPHGACTPEKGKK